MNSVRQRRVLHACVFSAFAVVFGACGSDDDDEALGGVDGSKRLAELEKSEYARVCDAQRARLVSDKGAVRGNCLIAATVAAQFGSAFGADAGTQDSDAEFDAACEKALQECIDEAGGANSKCNRVAPTCTATVAELDHCFSLSLEVLDAIGKLECSALRSDQAPNLPHAQEVDRCTHMLDACFVDEDDVGGDFGDAGSADAGTVMSVTDGG